MVEKNAMKHPSSLVQRHCAKPYADSEQLLTVHKDERAAILQRMCNYCSRKQTQIHTHMQAGSTPPTQSGSVFADQPAVIGEKRSQAD